MLGVVVVAEQDVYKRQGKCLDRISKLQDGTINLARNREMY